ncbi:MAG: PhnH protein [Hyphomonadaceae bacterium]|nr:MAG: PhnH protein [Hyphomonadaceae bacterium]KAF0183640.1 MAG: PhnH protein [Hyphomonadaceae bacterium]
MNAAAATPLDLSTLLPGFSEPARQSQSCFRLIMDATALPGSISDFADLCLTPPQGIDKAAAACLLTLADADTNLWLDPALRNSESENWLRFHTGAPITTEANTATFALISSIESAPNFGEFNQGDAKYPDRSTTILVMVSSLSGGTHLTLRGPGINDEIVIAPRGLSEKFWRERDELVAHFQFGIDLILSAGSQLVSIPRTTRITY